MNPVRILYLAPFPSAGRFAGGITTVASGIRKRLDRLADAGCLVSFFNTEPSVRAPSGAGRLRFENVVSALRLMRRVSAELLRGGFDVVNISSSCRLALLKDLLLARHVDRRFDGRIVLHVHYADAENILFGQRLLDWLVLRLMRRHVDDVIFLSARTRDEFVALGLRRERTHVLYNFHGVEGDPASVSAKAPAIRTKAVVDVLFMGSLDRRKGILELLRAATALTGREFRLHVCGRPNEAGIEAEMAPLLTTLGSVVTMHGYVVGREKADLLRGADVFVLPSHAEGLPIALLEAMASGCALVTTSVGAIPEILRDSVDCLFIEPGHVDELAASLRRLLDDREVLERLMRASLDAAPRFSVERFVDSLCEVYRQR